MGLKEEKLSHLHFYLHDIVSGPEPTAMRVVEVAMINKSATVFSTVFMMDDLNRGTRTQLQDGGKSLRNIRIGVVDESRLVDGAKFCFH
ncbi:Dirigent protein 11 [Vitis vinifera]|uniref:Dirigent protein n=1 Tax=Vitis vinifera TaxID=29760 RepID=A0A438HAA2_VITVI|nr:Dirigent protein 11 [Vitis vinifera]